MKNLTPLIFTTAALLLAQPVQALSLHEALAVAYQNNSRLKAERESLKATDESLPQAHAGWMPRLSAGYERGRSNQRFGTGDETQINPTAQTLTFSQPLFNGGQTMAAIRQANHRVASGQEQLRRIEQEVLNSAVAAYVEVVRAREVLELSKNNEKVLKEQLEATQSRFDLGETTKTDVAQSKSRLARAESDRITAEGNLTGAVAEYKRVFETDPPAVMTIPPKLPGIPAGFDAALKKALTGNPELKEAEYDSAAADDNVDVAKAALLPDVDLRGNVERAEHRSAFSGRTFEEESVTLNVAVPLYQSGSEYSRIREARRNAEAAKLQLDSVRHSVVERTTKAWKDVETSRANIVATEASVKSAQVALDGVRQEQEIGSRTVLDVLDAEQELFTARVNLITARRNEVLAVYRLRAAAGELTAQALTLKTDLYDPAVHLEDVRYRMIGF